MAAAEGKGKGRADVLENEIWGSAKKRRRKRRMGRMRWWKRKRGKERV